MTKKKRRVLVPPCGWCFRKAIHKADCLLVEVVYGKVKGRA